MVKLVNVQTVPLLVPQAVNMLFVIGVHGSLMVVLQVLHVMLITKMKVFSLAVISLLRNFHSTKDHLIILTMIMYDYMLLLFYETLF